MLNKPDQLLREAKALLEKATGEADVEAVRIGFFGKKGKLTAILRSMGALSQEERKELGLRANRVKEEIESLIAEKKREISATLRSARFSAEKLDVTEPGRRPPIGNRHPITQTIGEIVRIFANMGYSVTEGPEVETVFNNFDALNAAPNHPSRDLTDTFYITKDTLLRTQTSPVQVRTLRSAAPPIKVISPGRCFRTDAPDATHSPMFHQVEGLLVDEGVSMTDLKGVLDLFAKRMFNENVVTKFRPHFFPFTEPSAEMDMSCFVCGGKGCRVCGGSGWIEILGCGMVHPNVLRVGGVDAERYTGFAFGMGVERIAMLKHGVGDIRLFYENDIRFIRQFG
ncbi:MAG: phenylalanine--tRNA ligase subunit alpha [Clostridiales Family XIII bacterium]|jgi:phenylalanyl-tRNA synthetase alpha chain|nr:phenylalanine--tRNA ligase subunit alpha [Clostridiales Family XIII bacterium]